MTDIAGRIIGGRYQVESVLGQGGMATVYRAQDLIDSTTVAVKLLKPEVIASDPALLERFDREGQALRRLNHPNIVKVLAMVVEDDQHYVIMEFVAGGDLRELIDAHRRDSALIPTQRVLEIALDLSDALARAHRLKIIHRDLKPANVLLAEDGTPRLTDFGVAHFSDGTRMTQSGMVIGTLAYLSPEACIGDTMDHRVDIWAFGVMLYELLTLRRPFEAETTAALLTAIISREPESLAELRPDAPRALVDLVSAMLVKDPDKRIDSARLVGARLEAIISGREIPLTVEGEGTPTPTDAASPLNQVRQAITGFRSSNPESGTPIPPSTDHGEFVPDWRAGSTPSATTASVTAEATKTTQIRTRRSTPLIMAAVIVLIAGAAFLALTLTSTEDESNQADLIAALPPVEDGEYMVLVSQLERLDGTTRSDPTRFIVDDLTRRFEDDITQSNIRVRFYPAIIGSSEESLAIAEASGAEIIIRGRYDDEGSEIDLEFSSLADFPGNVFERDLITEMTDVRITMTNEREQTLAMGVLAALNVAENAEGDVYGLALVIAMETDILTEGSLPEVPGSSTAAHWHRGIMAYIPDTEAALAELDAAINRDAGNPLLYPARGLTLQRLGRLTEALDDMNTATRLGPDNWASPAYGIGQATLVIAGDAAGATPYFERAIAIRPDDWWGHTFLGVSQFLSGDETGARESIARAIDLGATESFPYAFQIIIAMREGDLVGGLQRLEYVQDNYPDPRIADRIISASYGIAGTETLIGLMNETFGNFTLGQWNALVDLTDLWIERYGGDFPEIYLIRGFAFCNLGDYAAAEEAYSAVISEAPDYGLAYALRAEVRQAQGDTAGFIADGAALLTSPQADTLRPFIPAFQSGELGCANFLDADLSQWMAGDEAQSTAEATDDAG
jgi:serine/threonine protein kinase/tetratricopeptide (TPR) repeat protein